MCAGCGSLGILAAAFNAAIKPQLGDDQDTRDARRALKPTARLLQMLLDADIHKEKPKAETRAQHEFIRTVLEDEARGMTSEQRYDMLRVNHSLALTISTIASVAAGMKMEMNDDDAFDPIVLKVLDVAKEETGVDPEEIGRMVKQIVKQITGKDLELKFAGSVEVPEGVSPEEVVAQFLASDKKPNFVMVPRSKSDPKLN